MLRSCLVQSTSKHISQVPVTWSRLFHIRKSLCLASKPGTGQHESEAGERGEQKDRVDKQNRDRNTDRSSSSYNVEKPRFFHKRENKNFQREMRNNQEYPTEGRKIPEYGGKFKSFDRERTRFPNERQEEMFDRKEMRYSSSARESFEGDKGFKQDKYSYSDRQNRNRTFDREQTNNYDRIGGQKYDRHEMSYNRPAREMAEQGRERYRGFRHDEYSSSDRDNYRYSNRQNQRFDRGQTRIYDERDEPDFDGNDRKYSRFSRESDYDSDEGRGFKQSGYRYPNRESRGRNFDRRQTSFNDERDEPAFDRKERRYSRSFRDSEHDSEEGTGFKQSGYRYPNKESRGRNFDRGQTSFYDERGEQSFDRQERTYARDFQSNRWKDSPYLGEKSDRPDFNRTAFNNPFVSDSADAESNFEAKTMEDTEVKQHLKGKLPKNWSDTFGTLTTLSEKDPTIQTVLFEEEDQISRTNTSETDTVYEEGVKIDEEEKPHIHLVRRGRRHVPHWYARRIMKLGKRGLVREAIEVFDKWMIEEDRVKPTYFVFGVLINILGKAGYTRKAFSLTTQMAKMDMVPDGHIFSSLFNACAKSPNKEDGLKRAHKLRMHMIQQGIEPHIITYGAMIYAFGMCGDTEMALSLVDEALQTHRHSRNLLNCALVACVSDKEVGFRHAIQVWRKFIRLGVRPDITAYNLLLRTVNECGVGPLTAENDLLLVEAESQHVERSKDRKEKTKIVSSLQYTVDPHMFSSGSVVEVIEGLGPDSNMSSNPIGRPFVKTTNFERESGLDGKAGGFEGEKRQGFCNVSADTDVRDWQEYGLVSQTGTNSGALVKQSARSSDVDAPYSVPETMPDILNPFDRSLQVVYLGWIKSSQHKLALLGGMKGILSNIEKYGAKPDIVTFTKLMSAASDSDEKEIWDMMALFDVKPDTDFFNHLIEKKAQNKDYKSALEVQTLMKERKLVPNLRTYGCLAKACESRKDAEKLLQSMENANMSPNYVIMHTLMTRSGGNFWYKKYILHKFEDLDLVPSADMIERIERQISWAKNDLVNLEQGREVGSPHKYENFPESFKRFVKFYESWLERTPIQKKEPVWREYKEDIEEPIVDGVEILEERKQKPQEEKLGHQEKKHGPKEGKHRPSVGAEPSKKIRNFKKPSALHSRL